MLYNRATSFASFAMALRDSSGDSCEEIFFSMFRESSKLSGKSLLQHKFPMSNARAASSAVSYVPSQIFFEHLVGRISDTYLFSSSRYLTPLYCGTAVELLFRIALITVLFNTSRRRGGEGLCDDDDVGDALLGANRHFFEFLLTARGDDCSVDVLRLFKLDVDILLANPRNSFSEPPSAFPPAPPATQIQSTQST